MLSVIFVVHHTCNETTIIIRDPNSEIYVFNIFSELSRDTTAVYMYILSNAYIIKTFKHSGTLKVLL